ncbi:hypothetical protein M8I35_28130 [Micromonospora sp. MSM11]|nr:hypothetical protein [Micromonospora sp. MSM11]MCL7461040.1 hypothetical protein [Micromonospora sp. MSM11]
MSERVTDPEFDECDCAEKVDAALERTEVGAGPALLWLVLDEFHPPAVALPRIKRGLRSRDAQTRANALQSLGHFGRLHRDVDVESLKLLRGALRDRTPLGGCQLRGYADDAADDIGMFAPRHRLPRWLRRRHAGPWRPRRLRGWTRRPVTA